MAPITSAAAASRSARSSASAAMPVITCVPLMSASPSFGAELDRRNPARPSASALGIRSPRKVASPSPISVRVMCASGARSPLAPTEPWHGTTGVTPRLSSSHEQFERLGLMPECPAASELTAQHARRAHDCLGERRTGSRRVAAHQIELQRAASSRSIDHVREPAEAVVTP